MPRSLSASFLRSPPTRDGEVMAGSYGCGDAPDWFSDPINDWALMQGVISAGQLKIYNTRWVVERCLDWFGLGCGLRFMDHCGTLAIDGKVCYVTQPYDVNLVSAAKAAQVIAGIVRCGLAIRSPGLWHERTTLYAFVPMQPPGWIDQFMQRQIARREASR